MIKDSLKNGLINSFYKDYQTIWLVELEKHTMELLYTDSEISADCVSEDLALYEKAHKWYCDNFVAEYQKESVYKQTMLDMVLEMTSDGSHYRVDYAKITDNLIKYSQVCFNKISDEQDGTEFLLLSCRDIDARNKFEIDEITGLYSRQTFFQKAEELLLKYPDKQFDIVISDISDFKKINDTYGVKVADRILRWTGRFLSREVREDLIVGRYGGDQMVMMGTHEEIEKRINEDGINTFLRMERENGLPSVITKFGVYENVDRQKSVVSSCDKARIALSSIKNLYEKKIAYYDSALDMKTRKQRRIEDSMYESLKNGDFKVFYQPKHDATTGKLIGAEALIRWIHPEYGFMSPADFIPLFEQNGFVVENDRFVWKRTCENLRRWEDKGIKTVPISINASKLTIAKEDLINSLQEPVLENNISPDQLHIEVTETMMTEDVDDLVNKLNALREIGYQIDLDDFGAGYSSINSLSVIPIDSVKLDMSFMQQLENDKKSKILAATINLAKELGYHTVSEGVELKEQSEVLEDLGVDAIQGFLYSKPLSEEEFEKYMLENQ